MSNDQEQHLTRIINKLSDKLAEANLTAASYQALAEGKQEQIDQLVQKLEGLHDVEEAKDNPVHVVTSVK